MIKKIKIQGHGDHRGRLHALEFDEGLPFVPRRIYYIINTLKNVTRGNHAHKNLKQYFVCVSGQCVINLDNGKAVVEHLLDSPDYGLLVDGVYWRKLYNFSSDCVLLVLASEYYDELDYIRDYSSFLKYKKRK